MAKIEFQKNSDHYKIVMFGKINFQERPTDSRNCWRSACACGGGEFATELLRNSECPLGSLNVKFERYCDTGIGFAMTKIDMACGA